jgi:hypothetical protein
VTIVTRFARAASRRTSPMGAFVSAVPCEVIKARHRRLDAAGPLTPSEQKPNRSPRSATFRARAFVSACCSQEDVMMQIGLESPSAACAAGALPHPDETAGIGPGPETPPASDPSNDAGDGSLFVSPPPLPFPRVFPGL